MQFSYSAKGRNAPTPIACFVLFLRKRTVRFFHDTLNAIDNLRMTGGYILLFAGIYFQIKKFQL